jgi:hypothetical protein
MHAYLSIHLKMEVADWGCKQSFLCDAQRDLTQTENEEVGLVGGRFFRNVEQLRPIRQDVSVAQRIQNFICGIKALAITGFEGEYTAAEGKQSAHERRKSRI